MMVGIVEGFYGQPWDLLDRISIVSFMGRVRLNLYIYAPKDDPYHRVSWRSPYPQHQMEGFSILIDACARNGVAFGYAISPGLDIDYSSKSDIDILIRKLDMFMDLGARVLGIFLDDVPPELRGRGFKSLAEAQASIANKVYRELSPDRLFLVPTYYWSYEEGYLRELGSLLDSGVEIVWTGRYVVSPTIDLDDLERFREITGRYPAIWDNYPVNDFFIVRGVMRLHMGPIEGRDPRIFSVSPAYMSNPMNQAEISKIPIYSVSRIARGYELGGEVLERAVELIANEEVWDALKLFVRLNSSSSLDPEADLEPGGGDAKSLIDMVDTLRRSLGNRKLLQEISPILSFIESLAKALARGEKMPSKVYRIQTAGLYDPPIGDESMVRIFGRVVRRKPMWIS
jgi:hyaluronoglucosaminidase